MNLLPRALQAKSPTSGALQVLDRIVGRNKRSLEQLCNTTAQIYETEDCNIGLIAKNMVVTIAHSGAPIQPLESKHSISLHTIRSGQSLVVTNLMRDKRFENNPFVKGEQHLRFYAGVPLKSTAHDVFGTIAICSRRARDFDIDKLRTLEIISHQVEDMINADFDRESAQPQMAVKPSVLTTAGAQLTRADGSPERRSATDFDDHKQHLPGSGICSKFDFLQSVDRAIEESLVRSRCAGIIAFSLRSRGRKLSVKQTIEFEQVIGNLVANHFRKTDVIGRVGPGQYALLAPLLHERQNLLALTARLCDYLKSQADAALLPEMRFHVRPVMYPIDGYDGEELLLSGFVDG
ncbi:MAG: GAF domain-containing protein [Hyphomicrobiales bacterium]|nr:GAF domain-containing protein [Hyphomicrobiales bacterium]MDE2115601.1 GAF domain-containing protein [Hyphomicrobiales bacterium]